jgi:hypothetical protein
VGPPPGLGRSAGAPGAGAGDSYRGAWHTGGRLRLKQKLDGLRRGVHGGFPFLARPSRRSGLAARTFTVGLMKPWRADRCFTAEVFRSVFATRGDANLASQRRSARRHATARALHPARGEDRAEPPRTVVIDVEALDPRFLVARVTDDMSEWPRGFGIRIRLVRKPLADHLYAAGAEPREQSHALNFEVVPLLLNRTALTFSVPGRKKNPDGISCVAPHPDAD